MSAIAAEHSLSHLTLGILYHDTTLGPLDKDYEGDGENNQYDQKQDEQGVQGPRTAQL